MGLYEEALKQERERVLRRQVECEHTHMDEVVYFRLCKDCGKHVAFRDPSDIERRGLIGQAPDDD